MEFTLTGFRQDRDIRHYRFECTDSHRSRREFTVDADVTLLRKYGIALQELPLLCRHLLEKDAPGSSATVLTFSESLMREHADHCQAVKRAAQDKRKGYRRPPANKPGQGWRGPAL